MRQIILVMLAAALIMPAAAGRAEAKAETHTHPSLPVSFKTFEGWTRVPRPGDEGTFEMASPGGKARVMVWYTSTEMDARRYLVKMADMKGLDLPEGYQPEDITTTYHYMVVCRITGTTLAVIPNGKTEKRPKENALFIIQIICSPEGYDGCEELMSGILESVRITGEGGP